MLFMQLEDLMSLIVRSPRNFAYWAAWKVTATSMTLIIIQKFQLNDFELWRVVGSMFSELKKMFASNQGVHLKSYHDIIVEPRCAARIPKRGWEKCLLAFTAPFVANIAPHSARPETSEEERRCSFVACERLFCYILWVVGCIEWASRRGLLGWQASTRSECCL